MELLFLALLIVLMAYALGSGYPVAFALPGSAIVTIALAALSGWLFAGDTDAYFAQGGPGQWLSAGVTNLRGVYWEVERDTLIAIPLFIFMGIMLQRSKIAEDLLVTMAQLFGPVRGGLGISVVFVGALLAATTGIVGATVVAMGLISLPAMLRNNYSKPLATGTIAASGTLGQIIPPSIVLIILADQLASATDQASTARKALHKASTGELSMPSAFDVTSTSAGEMFLGALVPGLVLVALYMLYILVYANLRPSVAPAVPNEQGFSREFWGRLFLALVPPLTLIFLVLGSIIAGIATVNQAGAIGAAGALLMAGYRLKEGQRGAYTPALMALAALVVIALILANFDTNIRTATGDNLTAVWIAVAATIVLLVALAWSAVRAYRIENTLSEVMLETAKTTSLVFIILLGAAMLTAAFRAFGGEELVKEFLESMPGGFWSKFIIVMAVIFILGFFLDFIEIAVVVVPIVAPILLADPSANITAVWLGVMIGLNIQTSFLTPPFGFALFYLRGVAPAVVKTIQMYKGVIAFIALQLGALVIVGLYPPLVNYLPNRVSLLSETAPPPRNPRLSYCVERYIGERLTRQAAVLDGALGEARGLDLSVLPREQRRGLEEAIEGVEETRRAYTTVEAAEAAVAAASPDYRPLHVTVRTIERQIREIDAELDEDRTALSRTPADAERRRARLEARIADLEAQRAELEASVPADWNERRATFVELTKAETAARTAFRRTADDTYAKAVATRETLAATPAFLALADRFAPLRARIEAGNPKETQGEVKDLADAFGDVAGSDSVRKELNRARRSLRRRPDIEKALASFDKAVAAYEKQVKWRSAADEADLSVGVGRFEAALRDTVGLRQQPKMDRDQALYMAACQANHRDLSLQF